MDGIDAADAITLARNRAVHPRGEPVKGKQLTEIQAGEAERLAIWYLELLLLRMLKYDGEYWDRIQREILPVPWSANPEP